MSESSIIYALYRSSETRHNLTKVGSTKISADSRAANYTDGEWIKYFDFEVSSHVQFAVERTAHKILRNKGFWLDPRVTNGTAQEIFTCEPEEAKKAIIDAVEMVKADLGRFVHPQTVQLFQEVSRLRDDKRRLEERLELTLARHSAGSLPIRRNEDDWRSVKKSEAYLQDQLSKAQKTITTMQFRINELEFYIEEAGIDPSTIVKRKGKSR